ncbi:MAG: cyclic nucleotide-binding domain-containing protein [Alphaproteobacteria bacterium]|nr:cyclic nucleotide-binding domain-containing protein [Alphaproteobacteria bacterium]
MSVAAIIGYVAGVVTLATYSMKTMIPLRVFGIAAEILALAYSYLIVDYPSLVLHGILVPLNVVRLYQMLQLVKSVRKAGQGDLDMEWLKPFMSSRQIQSGETLFRKGDRADEMFFVVSGRLVLADTGIQIGPGHIVGEFGLLTPNRARTQTLECVEGGRVLYITYDKVKELCFQNPKFGFYLLQLTSRRLFENVAGLEARLAAQSAV